MLKVLLGVLVILLAPLGLAPWVLAADNHWVRDTAGVLDSRQRQQLEQLLDTVQADTSAEVMVITVPGLEGEDIDAYATRMFNQIGIGQRDTNNGVLFLIAPNERRTRIEVGYGLEPLITDDVAGALLDDHVIPHFRQHRIATGIEAGTRAIADLLERYPDAARGVPGSAPGYVRSSRGDLILTLWLVAGCAVALLLLRGWLKRRQHYPKVLLFLALALCLGAAGAAVLAWIGHTGADQPLPQAIMAGAALVFGLVSNLRLFRRYRAHYCAACSGPMRLLSETEDNQYLNQVQQLEEKLRSVDYDVWICPACLKTDTERYLTLFRKFRTCPKCRAETFLETRYTLVRATRSHGGKVQIHGTCESCRYKESRIEHTPRITGSSSGSGGSSSGGSSGGGSSGGGGASRSW